MYSMLSLLSFASLPTICRKRARPERSESDQFLSDPLAFLKATYGTMPGVSDGGFRARSLPDLAVMYSFHLDKPGVMEYVGGLGLKTVRVVFNAHVSGDADSDEMYATVAILQRS